MAAAAQPPKIHDMDRTHVFFRAAGFLATKIVYPIANPAMPYILENVRETDTLCPSFTSDANVLPVWIIRKVPIYDLVDENRRLAGHGAVNRAAFKVSGSNTNARRIVRIGAELNETVPR